MKNLNDYIDQKNLMLAMFNPRFASKQITFPLSQQDVNKLAESIDCQLSPENLHRDGEASRSEVARTYKYLTSVATDLEDYCLAYGLDMPEVYEL